MCGLFVLMFLGLFLVEILIFSFFFAVTTVESGRRALQYLGLDGENSSVDFDVSFLHIVQSLLILRI